MAYHDGWNYKDSIVRVVVDLELSHYQQESEWYSHFGKLSFLKVKYKLNIYSIESTFRLLAAPTPLENKVNISI